MSLLRNAQFARLFSAQIVALVGSGLTTVALTLLAYQLSGASAGAVLGAVLSVKMVAYVFFAPIAGGLAHRFNRKKLLITLDLLRASIVLMLPFVNAIYQVYLLVFLLSLFSAGFKPIFQSTVPDILPDEEDYTRALSYSRIAYDLETLTSPMLAGVMLLLVEFDTLFVMNGLAFLVSALLVLLTTLPHREPVDRLGGLSAELTFGLRAYLLTPRLRGMLCLYLGVASASAMVIVNTVVYVREVLGFGDAQVALALAASGAGSMLTAMMVPRLLAHVQDRSLMVAGTGVCAAGLFALAAEPDFNLLMACWFLLGCGWSAVQTPAGRVVNRSSAVSDRPAYFAAQFALTHACWLVAYPVAGTLGSQVGFETTGLLLGTITLFAMILGLLCWPVSDPAVIWHTHEREEHRHLHHDDLHHDHEHGELDHSHEHEHPGLSHAHEFVIDDHHVQWPAR